jgi:hypothetical protein
MLKAQLSPALPANPQALVDHLQKQCGRETLEPDGATFKFSLCCLLLSLAKALSAPKFPPVNHPSS